MMTNKIAFGTKNPRRNLPASVRGKRTETLFQNAFLKQWFEENKENGVGGNQFEVSNYGIADFIWVNSQKQITAFEFKINDWKKGLMQAVKYRAYAHKSFLIVPPNVAKRALSYQDAIKELGVGLYSFDKRTKEIQLLFTATQGKPLCSCAYDVALSVLMKKRKFCQLCKAN